jgi:hypothetical protein
VLFKKKAIFSAVKIYSIGNDQERINRPDLVEAILYIFEDHLNELPQIYDIHGPYGIPKGKGVGIRGFKNKIEQKGHDKYYGLWGQTEKILGFNLLLGARIGDSNYSELILWYRKELFYPVFEDLVKILKDPFNASCAFQMDFEEGFDIFSESKIKSGIFGVSVEVNSRHKKWIESFESGGYRDIFEKNLFTESQYRLASVVNPTTHSELYDQKYFVTKNA